MPLIFVRHGQAEGVKGRCVGHFDAPLSQQGIDQIQALSFAESNATHIVSSDLKRAQQSAGIIARALSLTPATDPRLREMNFGEWDGRLWSELEQTDSTRLSGWMEHWTAVAPPRGETVSDLAARVRSFLRDMTALTMRADRTIIVVAHAGSTRAALCELNGVPLSNMFDIVVEHATLITAKLGASPRAAPQV